MLFRRVQKRGRGRPEVERIGGDHERCIVSNQYKMKKMASNRFRHAVYVGLTTIGICTLPLSLAAWKPYICTALVFGDVRTYMSGVDVTIRMYHIPV
jgi:hypothetical protein